MQPNDIGLVSNALAVIAIAVALLFQGWIWIRPNDTVVKQHALATGFALLFLGFCATLAVTCFTANDWWRLVYVGIAVIGTYIVHRFAFNFISRWNQIQNPLRRLQYTTIAMIIVFMLVPLGYGIWSSINRINETMAASIKPTVTVPSGLATSGAPIASPKAGGGDTTLYTTITIPTTTNTTINIEIQITPQKEGVSSHNP